jgi:WD40 repeat protein
MDQEFVFNEEVIFNTLRSKGFTSNCNFAFNSNLLVIGGKNANPLLYNVETGKMSEIGKKCSSQTDAVTASAISQDGQFAATGYPDGTIILWNLQTNSDGNAYKLIHKSTITNLAFICDHRRLITADYSGVITLLSLVQSLSCELVLQTTIINLKKPILSFVSLDPNHVAFSSSDMYSFISVDRNIAVHISKDIQNSSLGAEETTPHFSCAISTDESGKRALMCTNKKIVLTEVDNDKKTTEILKKDFESNIIQCFFVSFNTMLVVLEIGKALIFDISGTVKNVIEDLPTDVVPSNIQRCGNSLIFFLDNAIFQKRIPQ